MKRHGFSLIELMIALAIGSFLVIGAITVFTRSSATYAFNETLARLQENARYALNTIEPDLQLAGFWGLTADGQHIRGAIGNAPLSLGARATRCGPTFPLDLRRPVDGTNNAYALACAATNGAQSGSDAIITRHAEAESTSASDDRLQLYTAHDGSGNTLFISNSAPGPLSGAAIHNMMARAYYISRNSTGQLGLPALRRKTLEGGSANGPDIGDEEILPAVEDLQVQFGVDTGIDETGDGQPEFYTGQISRYVDPADPALATAVIITARIWIRIRSEAPDPGHLDDKTYRYADVSFTPAGAAASYRRLLVSRTIYLRNTGRLQP